MMYWCEDSMDPVIYEAQMDGTSIRPFVTEKIEYPVSLVVDVPSQRLFWADYKKNSIESIRVDQTYVENIHIHQTRMVVTDSRQFASLTRPVSIDVFEGSVFGLMNITGTLFKVDKYNRKILGNSSAHVILKDNIPKITKLRLYQENRQIPMTPGA